MTQITLNRGETLGILATPRDAEGVAIILDETWAVASTIASASKPDVSADLSPTITAEGKISIQRDTAALPAGIYHADIRITNPGDTETWTEKIRITLNEPVTKPAPRP
jgi:hypothetical protein